MIGNFIALFGIFVRIFGSLKNWKWKHCCLPRVTEQKFTKNALKKTENHCWQLRP